MNKELLVKGVNEEITEVLNCFDEVINAEFDDEATLQYIIDCIKNEWSDTKERLSGLGIEVKAEHEAPKNHYEVYGKLVESEGNDEIYLYYNGIEVRFDSVFIDENGLGDSILTLHRNDIVGEVATVTLKYDKEYEVVSSEHGCFLELVEK